METGDARAKRWLALRNWKPFPFQRRVWKAMSRSRSGLLHVSTGAGKTLAVWLGALERFVPLDRGKEKQSGSRDAADSHDASRKGKIAPSLTVLWLTPMRALAADTL